MVVMRPVIFLTFVLAFVSVFHRLTALGSVISHPQDFPLHLLTFDNYRFTSLAWNEDGTVLATGSENKTVEVWSVGSTGTFDCRATLNGHSKDNSECKCKHNAGEINMGYKFNPKCSFKGH